MKNLVLGLTLLRIILAPLILLLTIYYQSYWVAFFLFNLAAITDYLDGKIARMYKVESKVGAILDPIADKVLFVFTLISVILFTQSEFVAITGAFILGREFWVSALREFSSGSNKPDTTNVIFIAKLKTTFQFIAFSMYLLGYAADIALVNFLANFLLFLSALFAFKSAVTYSRNVMQ